MSDTSYGLLTGKRGIIFGAMVESSLAWAVAEAVHREGGRFVLTNAPITQRFGKLQELSELTGGSPIIYADATNQEDLNSLFATAKEHFGGPLDFIVHSIAMGLNVRKDREYTELNYEWFHKTLDISAISLHRVVTSALEGEVLADGASIVTMSYIGAQRVFSTYSEMGDAKALLESIVRSYGYRLGAHGIRINAVSQSPTRTVAGQGVANFDAMLEFAERLSPLGNADAASCADYTVTLLSDLTRSVTMQTLFNDGGFSSMGMSDTTIALIAEVMANEPKKNKNE